MVLPQLSAPGWALASIASLTMVAQIPNVYKPQDFMTEFELSNEPAAQFIGESTFTGLLYGLPQCFPQPVQLIPYCPAFLIVLINGYDLIGAMQDNWTVYRYSLMSRAVAVGLFWSMGNPWDKLVEFEGATFWILGIAMWFG